uniref:Uncharacterized protein n=1 Tax=Heliothis virescens TaxID=7102 RepID=A0A2A4K351_HELVI
MNNCEDFFNNLDRGGGMMPRKRFKALTLDARVYQEATNLMDPLDPPQPPPMPTDSVTASAPKNNFIRRKCIRVTFSARLRAERRGNRNTYVFPRNNVRQNALVSRKSESESKKDV